MIKKIFSNSNLSTKEKTKNSLFYLSRKRGAERSWKKRHKKVLDLNVSYGAPIRREVEQKHRELWSDFRSEVDLTTLRICGNISGVQDEKIIPEDIFVSDIEPSLVIDPSVNFLSIKSFYNRWFPEGIFPKDISHRIAGKFYDKNLNGINFSDFKKIAEEQSYPVVLKPNRESYGGQGVFFVKNSDELISAIENVQDFVLQERISQHSFFQKFNPHGLNTIRVYVYRSVLDEELNILVMALRMGKDGSLDNETAGGIHTRIRPDGILNGYAVDKYGYKYYKHPNTGIKFNLQIPDFDDLKKLAVKIAGNIFFTRIIGMDATYDENGNWRIIEINTKGHTLRFAQYGGQPFFGDFTEEVIEYCKQKHWALSTK